MEKGKGVYLALFAAIISGVSIFINSFGVKGFDSSVFAFSKNIVVSVMLLAIILGFRQAKELLSLGRRQWVKLCAIGLVGGSLPFLLFFKGLQMTTGQTSAFIHKTIFIYVTIFAVIFLKEKLTKSLLAGAGLLIAGNYFLIRPDFSLSSGHLLILAATILWAIENTYAKHVLKELSGNTVAFGRMFFGSAFILAFLAFTGKASVILGMSPAQYGWILLTSALLLLYVSSYYNALKHVRVTTAACILTLGSPITAILSWINGAPFSFAELAGVLLISCGVASILWMAKAASNLAQAKGVNPYGRG